MVEAARAQGGVQAVADPPLDWKVYGDSYHIG
ncbi:hypothetical protein HDC93_007164 [Streptomyces sp. AK010]|nr:hypothetical protein [Streptomyces sp. AK010]